MGLKCCGFIRQKLEEYPVLEPLALVLKKFLALRNLNSPFLGKPPFVILCYQAASTPTA